MVRKQPASVDVPFNCGSTSDTIQPKAIIYTKLRKYLKFISFSFVFIPAVCVCFFFLLFYVFEWLEGQYELRWWRVKVQFRLHHKWYFWSPIVRLGRVIKETVTGIRRIVGNNRKDQRVEEAKKRIGIQRTKL